MIETGQWTFKEGVISLQFSSRYDFASAAISMFERGEYSHVDTIVLDQNGNEHLLGARLDTGVAVVPKSGRFKNILRVDIPVSEKQSYVYHSFVIDQLGKPYDQTAIFAFIINRDWRDPNKWFCSELVAAGLLECFFFPNQPISAINRIAPQDLLLMVSTLTKIDR
jgi:hypothetical protein